MSSENGYIALHRKVKNNFLWNEKRVFSKFEAWLDILLTVNHCDAKVILGDAVYTCFRGESLRSLSTWGDVWNWDKSKVRRFLNLLQSENMIVLSNERKTTRLTVCNYDTYQNERNANETQMKRKRNANETRVTPNNNDNKNNNENNEDNIDSDYVSSETTHTNEQTLFEVLENKKNNFKVWMWGEIQKSSNAKFWCDNDNEQSKKFYAYWTEHSPKSKKLRWEKEKAFEMIRRLSAWENNNSRFEVQKQTQYMSQAQRNEQILDGHKKAHIEEMNKKYGLNG